LKIFYETGEQRHDAVSLLVKLIKLLPRDMACSQCGMKLRFHFRSRAFGSGKELNELTIATLFEAFGDI